VAGLLAAQRDEQTVTVILRSPPPLEKPLDVRDERLYDGDTLIAESESGELERDAPMTATVHDIPEVDERCVVVGEFHREQGRKCWASTAVYGADERLLGQAEQVWIRLP
jgi:hypothetical protein